MSRFGVSFGFVGSSSGVMLCYIPSSSCFPPLWLSWLDPPVPDQPPRLPPLSALFPVSLCFSSCFLPLCFWIPACVPWASGLYFFWFLYSSLVLCGLACLPVCVLRLGPQHFFANCNRMILRRLVKVTTVGQVFISQMESGSVSVSLPKKQNSEICPENNNNKRSLFAHRCAPVGLPSCSSFKWPFLTAWSWRLVAQKELFIRLSGGKVEECCRQQF